MAGEARSCDCVVERGYQGRERELSADVSRRLLAEREAVFSARLVEDFGLHTCHVNTGGAFCLARLASDAEVHDLLHAPSGELLRREGALYYGPEHVGPRPRGVLFVEGHHIGGTHRAPVLLRQKPLPLHSSTAFAKPLWSSKERLVFIGRRLRPGPMRSCRSIGGGATITPGFIIPSGSKRRLTSAKARRISPPYIFSINSERERPSPCSPEMDPPQSTTRSATSSAMRRIRDTPLGSEVSKAGLTCRHPTLAWP